MLWLQVFGIFNLRTDAHEGCHTDALRESELKAGSVGKIPRRTGELNFVSVVLGFSVRCSTKSPALTRRPEQVGNVQIYFH